MQFSGDRLILGFSLVLLPMQTFTPVLCALFLASGRIDLCVLEVGPSVAAPSSVLRASCGARNSEPPVCTQAIELTISSSLGRSFVLFCLCLGHT